MLKQGDRREHRRRVRIGVGLPATVPGTRPELVLEWARIADEGPFATLAILDRLLYDNYESLTTMGAVAALTKRIRLATTIVIAPLRSAALLAKQAATVNALSGHRFTLGVGLGAREDDYHLTGVDYSSRGRTLTRQLEEMLNTWESGRLGPIPGASPRPSLLAGGSGGLGMSRMARYADGFVHNGGPPRAFLRGATEARAAWEDLGRSGQPELWGMAYFQLEGDSKRGSAYLTDYYAFTGAFAARIAAGLLRSEDELRELAEGYAEAGCTDLVLFPVVAELEQLERLGEVLGRWHLVARL